MGNVPHTGQAPSSAAEAEATRRGERDNCRINHNKWAVMGTGGNEGRRKIFSPDYMKTE